MEVDWHAVRRKVRTRGWARDIVAQVRAQYERWRLDLRIPGPDKPSAWTHHYFCDSDGAPLRFDAASPQRHACTKCGRLYTGEPWDGAWRTRMHNQAAAQAQRAALLIRLAENASPAARRIAAAKQAKAPQILAPRPVQAEDAELMTTGARLVTSGKTWSPVAELERIFTAYDYQAYEPHGVHAGIGRVHPQSLDEAVWTVGMLRALRWAGDAATSDTVQAAATMAQGVIDLLKPQVGAIHNIHCWLLAALAECAALLDDQPLLAWCRDSEHGIEAQIRQGFHPEGLWYEINPHYHYYTVAALLSYAEVGGLSDEARTRLARAIDAPPALAYSDGRLPAYGDGWAKCFLSDFAPQAEAAWARLGPVDLGSYYAGRRKNPVRLWFGNADHTDRNVVLPGRSSVAALVFGPDDLPAAQDSRCSFVWPDAGIGVLRSPHVRLAMRFGPDAGGHDHRDKLAVDVETTGWTSLDLGTSGYGSDFTTWLRSPRAHNLIVVDGARQPPHTGRLLDNSPRHLSAESAWDGHTFRRTVTITDTGWTDTYQAHLDGEHDLEWIFHGDGAFQTGATEPADLDDPWLRDARRITGDRVEGHWPGSPRLTMPIPDGFHAYTATADGNPTGRPLGLLLLRGRARQATFEATFER